MSEASKIIKNLTQFNDELPIRSSPKKKASKKLKTPEKQAKKTPSKNKTPKKSPRSVKKLQDIPTHVLNEFNRIKEENQLLHELVKQLEPYESNFSNLRREYDLYQAEMEQKLTTSTTTIGKYILEQNELKERMQSLERQTAIQKAEITHTTSAHEALYQQKQTLIEEEKEIEVEKEQLREHLLSLSKDQQRIRAELAKEQDLRNKEQQKVTELSEKLKTCTNIANIIAEEKTNILKSELRSARANLEETKTKCNELQQICDNLLVACEKRMSDVQKCSSKVVE
jgi:chromosome segregation ATPase